MSKKKVEIIVKGPPNSGKSTLMMLIAHLLSQHGFRTATEVDEVRPFVSPDRISAARSKIELVLILEEKSDG